MRSRRIRLVIRPCRPVYIDNLLISTLGKHRTWLKISLHRRRRAIRITWNTNSATGEWTDNNYLQYNTTRHFSICKLIRRLKQVRFITNHLFIINKINSTAGTVRVKANRPGDIHCLSIFLLQMHKKKMSDLDGVKKYNIRSGIRWQISKSTKNIIYIASVFTDTNVWVFLLWNCWSRSWVQYSQRYFGRWMLISIKVIARIFTIALAVSKILSYRLFHLANLGQGHPVEHLQWCHSMSNIDLYKHNTHCLP